jgi:hypothetical protein
MNSIRATGLSLHLSGFHEHRQSKWSDSATPRLERCLPQILQEIELRGAAAEEKRLAAVERAAERRRRWKSAMAKATADYAEDYRGRVLEDEIDDWLRAARRREYLDAMEALIESLSDPERAADAKRWLQWSRRRASALDPLGRAPAMPDVPEPETQELKPFLHGWSPYGPEDGFGR